MGTHWYVVDEAAKQVLEVGKFFALAKAAGIGPMETSAPLTLDHVEASRSGWRLQHGDVDKVMDVEWSQRLAGPVERWIREVATGAPLTICRDGRGRPRPAGRGSPAARPAGQG